MMLVAVSGVIVGLLLGLTGAGGSIVAVPLLMVAMHWTVQQAAPVALLAVVLAAALGAVEAWRRGLVRYRAAGLIGVAGFFSAPIGVVIAHHLSQAVLLGIFAVVFAYVGARMFCQARRAKGDSSVTRASLSGDAGEAICRLDPTSGRIRWSSPCAAALGATGIGTGIVSGMLGVGGGFVIVPALRRATELTMEGAVATSLFVITFIGGAAILFAIVHGQTLPLNVAIPFVAGSLGGMVLGRVAGPWVSGSRLQIVFAALLGCLAVVLAYKALRLQLE